MEKKIVVTKGVGKTSGKLYTKAELDLGYRTIVLTWDIVVCAELLGVTPPELYAMDNGSWELLIISN